MITFADQVVLVTGAGRGLGASYARLLAARGATVVVHDAGVERDGSGEDPGVAAAVAESIVAGGGQAEAESQNLADRKGCTSLVASVLDRHGRVDALVHSAGIVRYHGIADTTDGDWQRMLDVNVSATWWLCQAVWPGMVTRGYGRIVLTTSGFALRAIPGADVTGYSVGKAAQFGLMNALAAEGEPHGIRVNALAPVAATRIFRREVGADEMSPDSVAPAAAALASRDCPWSGRVLVAQDGEFAFDAMARTPVRKPGPRCAARGSSPHRRHAYRVGDLAPAPRLHECPRTATATGPAHRGIRAISAQKSPPASTVGGLGPVPDDRGQ